MYKNEDLESKVNVFRRFLSNFYKSDGQFITMELHKGRVTLLSMHQQNNMLITSRYTKMNFLPRTLMAALSRTSNIYLLGISLIMLISPELSPFYRWITIFPMGLSVVLYICFQLILDRYRCQRDNMINDQVTRRGPYEKSKENQEDVKWKDLKVGDIVYLIKGDIVPADLILLDTGQVRDREAICMLDTQYYDGRSSLTKKKSSYLTQLTVVRTRQKNQYQVYRKMLSGKLEYEAPNANTEAFHGRLKLKKDPKLEQLTIDNFIPKGTKIRQTSWLFGLVVYTGMNTKTAMSSKYHEGKESFQQGQANFINLLLMLFSFFFTLMSIIVLEARSDDAAYNQNLDNNASNGMKVFNLAILFSQLVPANLSMLYDLINFINKFIVEMRLIKENSQRFIQVHNPQILQDLGHVDYMLIDKTGTLTTSYYKMDSLLFGQKDFLLTHDVLFNTLQHTNSKKSDHQDEKMHSQQGEQYEFLIPVEFSKFSDDLKGSRVQMKVVKTRPNNQIFKQVRNQVADMTQSKHQYEPISSHQSRQPLFSAKKKPQQSQNEDLIQLVYQYRMSTPQEEYLQSEDHQSLVYDAFMKCILLCHEARPVYLQQDIQYESYSKGEEITLEFASLCGYTLVSFDKFDGPSQYNCKINSKQVAYQILGLNLFTPKRNLTSIVIQAPSSGNIAIPDGSQFAAISQLSGEGSKNKSILICKGDYEGLKSKLDLSQKEKEELESMMSQYRKRGVRLILFATKCLNERETDKYRKQFNTLHSSLTSQSEQLELLAIEYETSLSLIGMIGFKEELKVDAYDLLQTTKNCNISTWLLSGDEEAHVVSCAQSLELCDPSTSRMLPINALDKNEVFMQINTAIGTIENELKQQEQFLPTKTVIHSSTTIYDGDKYARMSKFTLLINGHSLEAIHQNSDIMSHFRFLACCCKHVIGFNLNSHQKEMICLMIRNYFPGKPVVMAVGDGFNDALMMQAANVSVEILNKGKRSPHVYPEVNAGDILVNQLSEIKSLLLQIGKSQTERMTNVMLFMLYTSFQLTMTLFLFNWFCQFSATSLHDSMVVFLLIFLFLLPNAILLGIYDEHTNPEVNQQFPALYIDGQIRTRNYFLTYLLESFFEALLSGALIFYACCYMVHYSTNDKGWQSNLHMLSTSMFYVLFFVMNMKVFMKLIVRGITIAVPVLIFNIGMLVCFVFINYMRGFSDWDYRAITVELFTRYNSIVGMILSLFGAYGVHFVVHDLIMLYTMPSVYDQWAFQNSEGEEWKQFNNKDIIDQCIDQQIHVSNIVSKVFEDATQISPYIQEMLNPGDTKVTEMKLRPLNLEMRESVLEQKYTEDKLDDSVLHFRIFGILMVLYFGIYAITDYYQQNKGVQGGSEYLAVFLLELLVVFFILSPMMKNHYYTLSHVLLLMLIGIKIAIDWISTEVNVALSATLIFIYTTISTLNTKVIPIVVYNIIYLIQLIARVILTVVKNDLNTNNLYTQTRVSIYVGVTVVILIIGIALRLLVSYYKSIRQRRNDYLARYSIEQDNVAAQDILSILVPKFVQQSIQRGVYSMQEAQNDVSILFCYICDFDSIMREEGKNVVLMLDSLFRVYDNLCIQHGVQKIETVGYTYMAATGIKACEQEFTSHILNIEKTMRLVNLAFDMVSQVQGRKYGKGNQIEIKIGIHVGRVIAGVIGHHKPQFSLIGDPVNQTSRVGSTGDTGAITLSEIAFKQAKAGIKFFTKKQKEAKGLGVINTYQVYKHMPVNYQLPEHQKRWIHIGRKVIDEIKEKKSISNGDGSIASRSPKVQTKAGLLLHKIKDQVEQERQRQGSRGNLSPRILPNQSSGGILVLGVSQAQPQVSMNLLPDVTEESVIEEDDRLLYETEIPLLKPDHLLSISKNQQETNFSFYNILREQNEGESRIALGLLWMTYFIITLLSLIVRRFFDKGLTIFILRAIFLIVMVILFPLLVKAYTNYWLNIVFYLMLVYASFTILYQSSLANSTDVSTICLLELLQVLIVVSNLRMFSFLQTLFFMMITLALFLGLYDSNNQLIYYYIYYVVCIELLLLAGYYMGMKEQIKIFNNLQINEEKKVKQIALVSQLLPTHSYLKMKNSAVYNKSDFIDEFDDVTMLFADIKGFTEYSHSQTPEGVVLMLRNLFTEFDKLCQKFNVYKVYTIGDCYVVMGFTNSAKRNPIQEAINTVKMGFEMVEIIMKVRKQINFPILNMRIGIHTGQMIGGIIGTDIVRYDLYGKDVSIANKMESSGVEGRVMISETTKHMIERATQKPFIFKFEKDVDLSKFGMSLKGYLVEPSIEYNQEYPAASPRYH